ncbi:MAG TPA: hypothetical protein VGR57_07545 [Ktedonobacterales bacterium]|nr:hypothetical protein [Ktedonobacterales bacterium]
MVVGVSVYYQVVSRPAVPGASWNYYPSWTPIRERAVAERLASFATRRGHEAVILEHETVERLGALARAVVDEQETRHLPALRYLPAAETLFAQDRLEQDIATSLLWDCETGGVVDALDGLNASEADQRRLALEDGPGGDVTADAGNLSSHLTFPTRKDVLRAWLRLWARAAAGEVGGAHDGTSAG